MSHIPTNGQAPLSSQAPAAVFRLSGPGPAAPALQHCVELVDAKILRGATIEVLQTVEELYRPVSALSLAAAAVVMEAPRDGHTCLSAPAIARRLQSSPLKQADDTQPATVRDEDCTAITDAMADANGLCLPWDAANAAYPPDAPFVEAFGRYYPHRFAVTEQRIAHALTRRARTRRPAPRDMDAIAAALGNVKGRQRDAILAAPELHFMLLTGGPGTGKTWTVRTLLAVEIAAALREGREVPRIALAAPTGKAAARVVESLGSGLNTFLDTIGRELVAGDETHLAALRESLSHPEARTLHRLLGIGGPISGPPRDAFINADIVVVDEVSMVDAPMMALLLEAMPEDATLILIGDPHQLASVDAGSALADLVELCQNEASLRDNLVELNVSRRFTAESAVGQLASAALQGDTQATIWNETLHKLPPKVALPDELLEAFVQGYTPLMTAAQATAPAGESPRSPEERDIRARAALEALGHFQILSAHREGGRSVTAINQALPRALIRAGLMLPAGPSRLAVGMPVMILKNDYNLQRFNGDIGVVTEPGVVSFLEADGSIRHLPAVRLPEHMIAFAITVHKSQGSEWQEVAVVLPEHSSRLLTRELVYTAISRAKSTLRIFGGRSVLNDAIAQRAERATGLVDIVSALLQLESSEDSL